MRGPTATLGFASGRPVTLDDGTMKLLSVNVGLPQEINWRGETVRTSIFKAPVEGRVRVTTLNVEGDRQSDLSVHGGSEIGRAHV